MGVSLGFKFRRRFPAKRGEGENIRKKKESLPSRRERGKGSFGRSLSLARFLRGLPEEKKKGGGYFFTEAGARGEGRRSMRDGVITC